MLRHLGCVPSLKVSTVGRHLLEQGKHRFAYFNLSGAIHTGESQVCPSIISSLDFLLRHETCVKRLQSAESRVGAPVRAHDLHPSSQCSQKFLDHVSGHSRGAYQHRVRHSMVCPHPSLSSMCTCPINNRVWCAQWHCAYCLMLICVRPSCGFLRLAPGSSPTYPCFVLLFP